MNNHEKEYYKPHLQVFLIKLKRVIGNIVSTIEIEVEHFNYPSAVGIALEQMSGWSLS